MSEKNVKVWEYVLLAALFCFAVSLFNLTGYIFSAIILVMLLFYGSKICLSVTDLWLLLFSAFYFFFYWWHFGVDVNTFILYLIGPWSAHIFGKLYIERAATPKSFILLILVLSSGMFLHGLLNILAYLRSDYAVLYHYYRQSVDFWRGELVNVKTTEMLYTFATGVGIGVLFTSCKTKYKLLSVIVLLLSVVQTVLMANRALLIIFIIVFLWRFCCWFADARVATFKKTVILLCCLLLFSALVCLIALNVAGIGDTFFNLKIVQRFTSDLELTRFDVWNIFFEDLAFLGHLFGGKALTINAEWGYLHNMWLDVYNVAGVIPCLILIVLTVRFMVSFGRFNLVMKQENRNDERIIFQSLMLAILLNMMIEPIIEANPYYFLMTLMFLGAMEAYTYKFLNISRLDSSSNRA